MEDQPTQPPAEDNDNLIKAPIVSGGAGDHSKRKFVTAGALLIVAILIGVGAFFFSHKSQPKTTDSKAKASTTTATKTTSVKGLQLDTAKQYGNKYADGNLPVGDNKYSSEQASVGNVYICSQYAQNLKSDQGGADTRGPWFSSDHLTYNINKKAHVSGSVKWQASFSNSVSGDTRTITTNDLPTHTTGVFPIASSDAAYSYDRNPNSIKSQTLSYQVPANPVYGDPNCMSGEVGVMLTGVALFNGFDAGGRDAGAWEVQDNCSGHPQVSGEYHYHTLSACISDTSVSTVIGYALDGFPITGPQVSSGNILTTSDLDVCHGLTSQINIDNKPVTMYHYVMTQDFPYSVSCFRGKASDPPHQEGGSAQQGQGQGGSATQAPDTTMHQGPPPQGPRP